MYKKKIPRELPELANPDVPDVDFRNEPSRTYGSPIPQVEVTGHKLLTLTPRHYIILHPS